MKTTDGHDLEKGSFYFTVDGKEVILEDFMKLDTGEYKYLVKYWYEGTGMDVKCYGGAPVEIDYPFEIEGDPTIINKLFKNPPVSKQNQELIELKKELSRIKQELETLKSEKDQVSKDLIKYQTERDRIVEEVAALSSSVVTLTAQNERAKKDCTNLEHRLGILNRLKNLLSDNDKELIRLQKRDEKLSFLEAGGVDNWEWYGESLEGYEDD